MSENKLKSIKVFVRGGETFEPKFKDGYPLVNGIRAFVERVEVDGVEVPLCSRVTVDTGEDWVPRVSLQFYPDTIEFVTLPREEPEK